VPNESPDNWEPSADDLAAADALMREIGADNVLPTADHLGIEHARDTVRVEHSAEQIHRLQEKLVDSYAHLLSTPEDFEFRDYLMLLDAAMQRLATEPPADRNERARLEYDVEQMIEKVLYSLRKGGGPLRGVMIEKDFRSWPGRPPHDALRDNVDVSKKQSGERYRLRADVHEQLCQVSDVLNATPSGFEYRFISMRILNAMTELSSPILFVSKANVLGSECDADKNLTTALYHLRKGGGSLSPQEARAATEDYVPPR